MLTWVSSLCMVLSIKEYCMLCIVVLQMIFQYCQLITLFCFVSSCGRLLIAPDAMICSAVFVSHLSLTKAWMQYRSLTKGHNRQGEAFCTLYTRSETLALCQWSPFKPFICDVTWELEHSYNSFWTSDMPISPLSIEKRLPTSLENSLSNIELRVMDRCWGNQDPRYCLLGQDRLYD